MSYSDDRFDPAKHSPGPEPARPMQPNRGPRRDAYDQPHEAHANPRPRDEEFGIDENEERSWRRPRFVSKDTEPMDYKTGDPNAEFGVDERDGEPEGG